VDARAVFPAEPVDVIALGYLLLILRSDDLDDQWDSAWRMWGRASLTRRLH
jgi:hypothetical protein